MSRAETESTTTAIENLESDVHDLDHMAAIVADRIENLLHPDLPITGDRELYRITWEEANVHLFAVYRLQDMIRDFKDKYVAALIESNRAKRSSRGQK